MPARQEANKQWLDHCKKRASVRHSSRRQHHHRRHRRQKNDGEHVKVIPVVEPSGVLSKALLSEPRKELWWELWWEPCLEAG